jgi:acylphosphatase
MNQCERFMVKGRVQGVFFRAATQQCAMQLGLTGWVRNLPNGDVELLACGTQQNLERLYEWLWQGPSHAKVEDVRRQQEANTGFEQFSVLY